jgi:hypothetical protein
MSYGGLEVEMIGWARVKWAITVRGRCARADNDRVSREGVGRGICRIYRGGY